MRVIAGKAKGRRLSGPRGRGTRPSSELVRGAIFSALASLGADLSRVLDLYAGTGALGIEALSRGALWCDFVEKDARACAAVRDNLARTGFADRAQVHCAPVDRALERLEGTYTLVLADPPYAAEAAGFLVRLGASALVEPGKTVLVLEHSAHEEGPERLGALSLLSRRRHGDTAVSIYR